MNYKFYMKIDEYFRKRPQIGRIKIVSLMKPWGYGNRYHVKCTLRREYIVYEQDGEIKNVGIHIPDC